MYSNESRKIIIKQMNNRYIYICNTCSEDTSRMMKKIKEVDNRNLFEMAFSGKAFLRMGHLSRDQGVGISDKARCKCKRDK